MLNNNGTRKYSHKPNSDSHQSAQAIPDPWLISSNGKKVHTLPETWQPPTEPHLLTSTGGGKEAPKLAAHQLTSAEILLRDELKLKNSFGSLLKQQLEKALALLYWGRTQLIL